MIKTKRVCLETINAGPVPIAISLLATLPLIWYQGLMGILRLQTSLSDQSGGEQSPEIDRIVVSIKC